MHTYHRSLALTVLVAAGLFLSATDTQTQTPGNLNKGRTRDIYVSVTDKSGAPVSGLQPTDFSLKEDNQSREVLAVAPAATPMRIALLVDNSQATQDMTTELRQGMTQFIEAIFKASPESVMSLSTFGDRPTLLQDFTSAGPVLSRAANRLFYASGSGAYMTDAVLDAARALRKDPAARQLIVAFVNESGAEFSSASRQQALEALHNANASLWVVSLQGNGAVNSTEGRDRSALISEGASQSGGAVLSLLNRLTLPQRMTEVAAQITHQWQVTYGRPEQMIPPKKLDVQLTRKDLKLQAPRWSGQ